MIKQEFDYEESFWGNCQNTFKEEEKQLHYAHYMGLSVDSSGAYSTITGLNNKSILDIGGGPTSLLLKTTGLKRKKVIDPLQYPTWVYNRYDAAGIEWEIQYGELINEPDNSFDEVWIYNVLQHTTNPEQIIGLARNVAPVIRMFEWINLPAYPGHPQALTKERLDKALGATGQTAVFENTDCYFIWLRLR
jgi:2-polyprenyl-3-methyl-5-hydroxy-6-metoxy-1,4-benzoquinol methylase